MSNSYDEQFEQIFCRINFNLMKDKMFIPIGLELSATNVYFEHNDDFALKNMTFAYYNPIDNSIRINIEHPFFVSCNNNVVREAKLLFILFHEINHKLLMHTPQRLGNRIPTLWNIAADYEVHNMLYVYMQANKNDSSIENIDLKSMFREIEKMMINSDQSNKSPIIDKDDGKEDEANPKFFFDSNMISNIAEEIYALIENSKESDSSSTTVNMGGNNSNNGDDSSSFDVTVDEVTYTLPNGQKIKTFNINWPDNKNLPADLQKSEEQEKKDQQRTNLNRSLMENQLNEMSKQKGTGSSACNTFLKKLFHIKIDWEKILRNSLQTILEKTDYFSWSKVRTSTFLLPNMSYLPDIVEDNEKYGTLIIARDESGSMSNAAIAKAAQIIIDAKAHYKKIVVLKHDYDIVEEKEFEDIDDNIIKFIQTRSSNGGTSHKAVFEYLRDYKKKYTDEDISCFIGITDLESDIIANQNIVPSNIPMVWLAPISSEHYFEKGIKGKIIPIEL